MTNTTEAALRDARDVIERLRMWCRNQKLIDAANELIERLDHIRCTAEKASVLSQPPASSPVGEDEELIVERMAYGYELMFRAICNIAGTSGASASWYRQQANEMLERMAPLHGLSADSNPHKPGDCLTQYKRFAAPASSGEPASVAGEAEVWSKPEYVAADRAYQKALTEDCNDRMSALAAAVDAALALSKPTPVEAGALERAKAVNTILAELIGPYEGDIVKRIEIGNRACRAILAALSETLPADSLDASLRDRAFAPSASSQPAAVSPVPASIPSAEKDA